MEVGLNWAASLPLARSQAGARVCVGTFLQSVTNSSWLHASSGGPPRFLSSLPPAARASPAAGRLSRSKGKENQREERTGWVWVVSAVPEREVGGGGCDHGRAGPEAREQLAAAAAAPAPSAGAVSQQNASPCGGAGPARGAESREREPALWGAAVLLGPGAGDCSLRPSAPRPGEPGGGGGGDRTHRAWWTTADRRRWSPGAFCLTPWLRALRCRCVRPRGGRGAAARGGGR